MSISSILSFRSFFLMIVLLFAFGSAIFLELSFGHDVRYWSTFMYFENMDIQLNQHHVLGMPHLSPHPTPILQYYFSHICVCVKSYFQYRYYLCYIKFSVSVVISYTLTYVIPELFWLFRSLAFPHTFQNHFPVSRRKKKTLE